MVSTFHGLEVAKRGMMTQQSALYTTGHNIANANTPGYTRQRVNFEQTEPYPPASRNRPQIPGQLGTGVKAGDIQRIRDSFVDAQFRGENSKLAFWEAKAEMLRQMENIMNEPSDTGLANTMDEFWNALQDLAVQPQNDGARRVVRQRGIALANTFNYIHNSLKAIQTDYRNEIDVSQKRVNSLLRQINQVNKQIGSIEPHGYLPNDLYDERDRLVDELSTYMNIIVERKPSGGLASGNAEGLYNIYLADSEGKKMMVQQQDPDNPGNTIEVPVKLIEAVADEGSYVHTANGIDIQYDGSSDDSPVKQINLYQLDESGNVGASIHEFDFANFNTNGSLKGYIEGYGYTDGSGNTKGTYNEMLRDLDEMAYTFAEHFNLVHQSGWSLNEIANGTPEDISFFDLTGIGENGEGAAAKIKVHQDILDDVGNIAAAAEGNVVAGSFERLNSNPDTVGNPSFSGVFDPSFTPSLSPESDSFKIDLTYDKTNDKWTYTVTSFREDGSTIGVSNIEPVDGKLFGIEIDTSHVSAEDGDKWTFTFSKEGVKSIDDAFIGNGSNALALSKVKDAMLNYGGSQTNVHTFYQGMIGTLGDQASESNRMTNTAATLKESVEQRRMSISNVSLDEEMTNMIQFQHAYNASARMITLIDETLDRIINGMGLVGR